MKKIFSLIAVVSAAMSLTTSCSSDDAMSANMEPATENIPSEVPIALGAEAASISTRAAVMSKTTLPGSMGVWCLAKGLQNINQNAQPISWFSTAPSAATCCIMKNVKSDMVDNKVSWNGTYYYPVSQFYRYEFYSVYPYTTNISYTLNRVRANYTIDGKTDIIWGRATSDVAFAWSANYFRQNGGASNSNIPDLKLEHLLSRLTFTVEPGATVADAPVPDYTEASKMKVLSIQLCDVITKAYVTVADYSNLEMDLNDRLQPSSYTTDTLSLCDATGVPFTAFQVPATPEERVTVGESIMLMPSYSYMLRVVLEDAKGTKHITETPLTISSDTMFERGNSYRIGIVVHGPQDINVKAQIHGWEILKKEEQEPDVPVYL